MARGVRGGSKASRDSQKRLRDRNRRKKWAQELEGLQGGKNYKLVDLWGIRKKRRVKSLKSKLNIPDKSQTNQDHLGRDSSVGAKKRKSVRQNPVSDETLKTVRTTLAKEKATKLKITGKGPVKSGEEYGKHLDKQSKKYETKGEGPVRDSKKYGKTLKTHAKKTAAEERAAWLKKTRNSPAARSGAFSDDERWELQQKHRKWESDRKEGKLKREKFDPRKPRGYKRKLVQKTPAELAAERRKRQLKNAQKDNTSKKSDINKKKEAVFNLQKGRYEVL